MTKIEGNLGEQIAKTSTVVLTGMQDCWDIPQPPFREPIIRIPPIIHFSLLVGFLGQAAGKEIDEKLHSLPDIAPEITGNLVYTEEDLII